VDADPSSVERELLQMTTIEQHLDDLAMRASHHLGGGIDCSIILRHRGEDRRVASSTERAGRCDDAENAAGSGPCLTAIEELHTVFVPDVLAEQNWPEWRRQVIRSGYRSGAAFPVDLGDGADVAFNLYSDELNPWARPTVLHADMYAQQIGTVLALCLEVARLTHSQDRTGTPAPTAGTIDRAVGVVMAQHHLDADQALQLLTREAAERRVDIVERAASVLAEVARRTGG
jgi:hypothetical protein